LKFWWLVIPAIKNIQNWTPAASLMAELQDCFTDIYTEEK